MPGGRGISFYPSGRWTRSCSAIRPSASRASPKPVRPFSVRFPVFLGPEFRFLVLVWCFFFGLVAALVSGFGWFSSGFFFLGSASVGFGGVSLLLVVLLSLASFLHRESAPPASRPQWRPTPHPL